MPRRIDTAFVEFVPDFTAVARAEKEIAREFRGIARKIGRAHV